MLVIPWLRYSGGRRENIQCQLCFPPGVIATFSAEYGRE